MPAEVFHLDASDKPRHLLHDTSFEGGGCTLETKEGTSSKPIAFNLAPNHAYEVRHRLLKTGCRLTIAQGKRVKIEKGKGRKQAAAGREITHQCSCCGSTLSCLSGQPHCVNNTLKDCLQ